MTTDHTCLSCVLQTFDELLLMKRGGRIIFFGETGYRSQKLVDYFEVTCCVLMHRLQFVSSSLTLGDSCVCTR